MSRDELRAILLTALAEGLVETTNVRTKLNTIVKAYIIKDEVKTEVKTTG